MVWAERRAGSSRFQTIQELFMDWHSRIVINPKILVGKPVIRGTRISVEFVVDLVAVGWSHEKALESYPHVSEEDIRACLVYAGDLLREEQVYPLATA
jgi:uncharacterized protein (DUF433 family)